MKNDASEGVRVGIIGATGFVTSLTLAEWSAVVSICVGVVTLVYISGKTYYLFRNQGR